MKPEVVATKIVTVGRTPGIACSGSTENRPVYADDLAKTLAPYLREILNGPQKDDDGDGELEILPNTVNMCQGPIDPRWHAGRPLGGVYRECNTTKVFVCVTHCGDSFNRYVRIKRGTAPFEWVMDTTCPYKDSYPFGSHLMTLDPVRLSDLKNMRSVLIPDLPNEDEEERLHRGAGRETEQDALNAAKAAMVQLERFMTHMNTEHLHPLSYDAIGRVDSRKQLKDLLVEVLKS